MKAWHRTWKMGPKAWMVATLLNIFTLYINCLPKQKTEIQTHHHENIHLLLGITGSFLKRGQRYEKKCSFKMQKCGERFLICQALSMGGELLVLHNGWKKKRLLHLNSYTRSSFMQVRNRPIETSRSHAEMKKIANRKYVNMQSLVAQRVFCNTTKSLQCR